MNDILLDILACPFCKGDLLHNKEKKELICIVDRLAYPIKNDIPVMIMNQARRLCSDEYFQTIDSN